MLVLALVWGWNSSHQLGIIQQYRRNGHRLCFALRIVFVGQRVAGIGSFWNSLLCSVLSMVPRESTGGSLLARLLAKGCKAEVLWPVGRAVLPSDTTPCHERSQASAHPTGRVLPVAVALNRG